MNNMVDGVLQVGRMIMQKIIDVKSVVAAKRRQTESSDSYTRGWNDALTNVIENAPDISGEINRINTVSLDKFVTAAYTAGKGGKPLMVVLNEILGDKSEENKMVSNNDNDMVNQPEHYRHGTFEVIDEMLLAFGAQRTYDFCIMNAWKYRSRAPYKGAMEQDMEKADRYMQMAKQIVDANKNQLEIFEVHLIKSIKQHTDGDGNGADK